LEARGGGSAERRLAHAGCTQGPALTGTSIKEAASHRRAPPACLLPDSPPYSDALRQFARKGRPSGRDQYGHTLTLRPFMGIVGMPPAEVGIYSTVPPRFCGGEHKLSMVGCWVCIRYYRMLRSGKRTKVETGLPDPHVACYSNYYTVIIHSILEKTLAQETSASPRRTNDSLLSL